MNDNKQLLKSYENVNLSNMTTETFNSLFSKETELMVKAVNKVAADNGYTIKEFPYPTALQAHEHKMRLVLVNSLGDSITFHYTYPALTFTEDVGKVYLRNIASITNNIDILPALWSYLLNPNQRA